MDNETSRFERTAPTLDDTDLRHLAPLAIKESFEPGAFLLRFGEADVDLLVVESGEVEVLNPAAGDMRIATRGVGEFVGDIDLMMTVARMYDGRFAAREAHEALEAEWEIPKVPEVSDTNFDEYELMERSWAGTVPAGLELPSRTL